MKRFTALFTTFALMCSIFITASASNEISLIQDSSISNISVGDNELSITTTNYEDGRIVVNAIADNEASTATRIGNIIYVTEISDGITTEYSIDLDDLPDCTTTSSTPYSTYDTIESDYWNFTCLRSWSDEASHGLFWSMHCDNGQYSNYDEKSSMARGYGEAFWDDIVSMNSHFSNARLLVGAAVIATMAASAASAGTLTAAAAILSTIAAGAPAVGNMLDAKSDALDANYNFDRFKANT